MERKLNKESHNQLDTKTADAAPDQLQLFIECHWLVKRFFGPPSSSRPSIGPFERIIDHNLLGGALASGSIEPFPPWHPATPARHLGKIKASS
jgi:hypothetical protein